SAIKEIQHIAQTKSLKLNLKVAEGTYKANIDKGKMKQIISNIIDNAVKYTIKGSVNVDLLRKNENILIKISDTGIGLPKGTSSKLFKKFGRLNNANDANIDGTGLGLYLAKVVIDAHKGKIWAESKGKEKGTTFFIRLKAI
ncbi:HAMP domain-containing histidine kinase, partial [Patescibacteria group bacterium]|nr:HAMP domain-containing histidine kinase [Patescibacteria group bacterium]